MVTWLLVVVALAGGAVAANHFISKRQSPEPKPEPVAADPSRHPPGAPLVAPPIAPPAHPAPATQTSFSASQPAGPTAPVLPPSNVTNAAERAKAKALAEQGMALLTDGKLLDARGALCDALNSGALDETLADAVRKKLADLADRMLLGPDIVEGDPCVYRHKLLPGEVLNNLERSEKLHVPAQLIAKINGIADPSKLRAGTTIKLIRGPFHAVVYKKAFRMDLFLTEPTTGRLIFVRRFAICTGAGGSTPTGKWRVAPPQTGNGALKGGKTIHTTWAPPPASGLPSTPITWSDPPKNGYRLGKNGYWIPLEGIEDNALTVYDGYAIHDTCDQASIGKEDSLGCIRLGDADIEFVYSTLYELKSTVTILP
jgi:hypothetical protein